MLREIDQFFLQQKEPIRSCLLSLRHFILRADKNITEAWRYKMPFYYYKGKMFCYVWVHKKKQMPYLGIVEGRKINHPQLIAENRSRMKIMLLDPQKDLPTKTIEAILKTAIRLYESKKIYLRK